MKVLYTTQDGRMTFELEGETQQDVWKQLASVQEIFEDTVCRKNGKESNNVRFRVREVDGNEFYELVCMEPGDLMFARKSFGSLKSPKGGLFPKTKDSDGNRLPDYGWVKWNKESGKEE